MGGNSCIHGPYKGRTRIQLRSLTQEAFWAVMGVIVVGYVCYALMVG